jgi:hypothetical protein
MEATSLNSKTPTQFLLSVVIPQFKALSVLSSIFALILCCTPVSLSTTPRLKLNSLLRNKLIAWATRDVRVTYRHEELAHFHQRVGDPGVGLCWRCECRDLYVQVIVKVRVFGVSGGSQLFFLQQRSKSQIVHTLHLDYVIKQQLHVSLTHIYSNTSPTCFGAICTIFRRL